MKEVANNIRKYRLERSFTQEELAQCIKGFNVTKTRIEQYENGIVYPTLEILRAIANALDIPTSTILGMTNEQRYEIYKKDFGDRIRHKRNQLNLTQAELGKMLGIKEIGIRQYENGRNIPRGTRLFDLADVLQTTVNYLLIGKD